MTDVASFFDERCVFLGWRSVFCCFLQQTVQRILIPFVFQQHWLRFTGFQSFSFAELDKAFPWRDIRFHVTIIYWTSLFTQPPPLQSLWTGNLTGQEPIPTFYWYLVAIIGNLLKVLSLQETSQPPPLRLVLTSVCTYGRHQRAVHILLECFLVDWNALNFSLALNYS